MKALVYLIRTSFCSYTAITVLALFSILVAVFGTNVVLGFAQTHYQKGAGSTMYTVITLAGLTDKARSTDMMTELAKYKPSAALYFCRSEDGAVLVGFDGSDGPENWWAGTWGGFVADSTAEEYPQVIYLNEVEIMARELSIGDLYELDGKEYRLIGYGSMMHFNFIHLISKRSPQNIFDRSKISASEEDTTTWTRVIPYAASREIYEPDLIQLHFPEMNYGQILRMTERLEKMFPGCTVTPPNRSSDELFQYALEMMVYFIPLYLILTEISVILALGELYKKLRAECYVLRICGISRRRLRWLLIAEVALLFVLGTGISLVLQAVLKTPLSFLRVEELPTAAQTAAGAGTILVIAVLGSLPELIRGLRLQRAEEA